jgi:methylenetetrahydrofolate reductase (NADPH)
MKVIDKIKKAEEEGRVYWSFEYFPPKTQQVIQELLLH